MARTATLSNLRTRVRQRADMVDSNFCSDTEINEYINTSIAELYDLLIESMDDYYLTSANLAITSGTDYTTLPSDFYKLAGIDVPIGSKYISLRKYNFKNRNREYLTSDMRNVRYRIEDEEIRWHPTPTSTVTAIIWYHPYFTALSADDSTFDGINGWEEYVVVDAAIKCLRKEESDTSELMNDKLMLLNRIKRMAQNRDMNEPETIWDSEREDFVIWY